jgi:hypothetical protein
MNAMGVLLTLGLSAGAILVGLLIAGRDRGARGGRGALLRELARVEAEFLGAGAASEGLRGRYADLLYESGDFGKAREILAPLARAPDPPVPILFRSAELKYLAGEYEGVEEILKRVIAKSARDGKARLKAQLYLVYLYYQTLEFQRSAGLFKDAGGRIELPLLDLMRSFGERKPYGLEWADGARETALPFARKDPLPLVSVELEGRELLCFIDTGADMFILDTETARELGIAPIASSLSQFGGGRSSELAFGRASSLRLGEARLSDVPIAILPLRRFSEGLAGGGCRIEGALGTGLLKRFLPTIDYPGGRLILRPRRPAEAGPPRGLEGDGELPFSLWATHLLLVRGAVNGREGLTLFADSGLASEASLSLAAQTLEYLGIPRPRKVKSKEAMGGGGGAWASGFFPIESAELGGTSQGPFLGELGAMSPGMYRQEGFILDGIVSHGFLRSYAWTIDFDRMRMRLRRD